MTLIPCDCNCIYQNDGYCHLDEPSKVTNSITDKGCAYFIERNKKINSSNNISSLSEQKKPV